jgi:hypothetical protein
MAMRMLITNKNPCWWLANKFQHQPALHLVEITQSISVDVYTFFIHQPGDYLRPVRTAAAAAQSIIHGHHREHLSLNEVEKGTRMTPLEWCAISGGIN